MEKIFYVTDDELDEVNTVLEKGGKVKMIHAVGVDAYHKIYSYIVVEMPDNKKQN